jgi:hypothetical protein
MPVLTQHQKNVGVASPAGPSAPHAHNPVKPRRTAIRPSETAWLPHGDSRSERDAEAIGESDETSQQQTGKHLDRDEHE